MVLVTHYRNAGSNSGEYSGVALALALLEYLVDAKWLAKDVVLLFADGAVLQYERLGRLGQEMMAD